MHRPREGSSRCLALSVQRLKPLGEELRLCLVGGGKELEHIVSVAHTARCVHPGGEHEADVLLGDEALVDARYAAELGEPDAWRLAQYHEAIGGQHAVLSHKRD